MLGSIRRREREMMRHAKRVHLPWTAGLNSCKNYNVFGFYRIPNTGSILHDDCNQVLVHCRVLLYLQEIKRFRVYINIASFHIRLQANVDNFSPPSFHAKFGLDAICVSSANGRGTLELDSTISYASFLLNFRELSNPTIFGWYVSI